MQEIRVEGLDAVISKLEESPEVFREARTRELNSVGQELLGRVQARIGGTGNVGSRQEYRIGSGKGYVAVRPKAKDYLVSAGGKRYATGAVTNALESGHAIRGPSGSSKSRYRPRIHVAKVPGKHMYQNTGSDAERLAQEAGARIAAEVVRKLEE
jgi:hypothetical protein|uniref:Uncharacterized protein n=1 Tax=Siphoviridae sp. ctP6113 TaxID=2826318 RepID=A0A8S5MU27_9CAUD|nr:MAG TPA: hypothetical protein [Siphoviridae sp. ctP6113]